MVLYCDTQATVRTQNGFNLFFIIQQGTREGCLLSPLLFLIFFSETEECMRAVRPDAGAVFLGELSAVVLLSADDTALITLSLSDAQKVLNAWGIFCDRYHVEVSIPKTIALCVRSDTSTMRLTAGCLYRRVRYKARSAAAHFERLLACGNGSLVFAWEPLHPFFSASPIEWAFAFKYLGTTLADTDARSMRMETFSHFFLRR